MLQNFLRNCRTVLRRIGHYGLLVIETVFITGFGGRSRGNSNEQPLPYCYKCQNCGNEYYRNQVCECRIAELEAYMQQVIESHPEVSTYRSNADCIADRLKAIGE